MTTYQGFTNGKVCVEYPNYCGNILLDPRTDLRNHSPTGFGWGYGGSGPAQLALAILVNHLGNKSEDELRQLAAKAEMTMGESPVHEALALMFYQKFKFKVIAGLPQDQPFKLTAEQVDEALTTILAGV